MGYFGNYNAPFVPMVALLCLGALLWLQVDPTRELFPEALPAESAAAGEFTRLRRPALGGDRRKRPPP